ncbi:craniofacial development protein 2-like [Penaeus japonicus]|uniref:craniofacial development protein 2-like n=1 Tax=Penaeus japonicus TaxID=27405 RepID=UPI001C7113AF|nr:craniofacial development protein 2-like [Penaeus japonicus]
MRENQQNTILDRPGPRIKTAATVAVGQQGSSGKYVTVRQPRENRRDEEWCRCGGERNEHKWCVGDEKDNRQNDESEAGDRWCSAKCGGKRVIGKYGYGAHNNEGQTIVDFAHCTDMAVINIFYSKSESHKVTYTSGGRHTQIDYILCRRMHLKEGIDCKVIPGESVAKQHYVVIGKMRLMSRRRRGRT